jgi:hypothetical protein
VSTGKRYKMVSTTSLLGEVGFRSGTAVSLPAAKTAIVLDPPFASTNYHVVFSNTKNGDGAFVDMPAVTSKTVNDFEVTPPEAVTTDWEAFLDS